MFAIMVRRYGATSAAADCGRASERSDRASRRCRAASIVADSHLCQRNGIPTFIEAPTPRAQRLPGMEPLTEASLRQQAL